jgi:hypothetical protein
MKILNPRSLAAVLAFAIVLAVVQNAAVPAAGQAAPGKAVQPDKGGTKPPHPALKDGEKLPVNEEDDINPASFGIEVPLRFSGKKENGSVQLIGHDRTVYLKPGLTAPDLELYSRENRLVYYVDLVPVPLENPNARAGLPRTIWDIEGHDDPTADKITATFMFQISSPLLRDTCRAWLRTHHLARFFEQFANDPSKSPTIEVRRLPVKNLWIGLGVTDGSDFAIFGEGARYIRDDGDVVIFKVNFTPNTFAKFLQYAGKNKIEYQYLAQPKGMNMAQGYKHVDLDVDVAAEIEQLLKSDGKAAPGSVVVIKDEKYLTQRGYHFLKQQVSAKVNTRVYLDGDAAAKYLMADPIPLGDWLQAQTLSAKDIEQLMVAPENQAFAQWLIPTMIQRINHDLKEKQEGNSTAKENANASGGGWGFSYLGLAGIGHSGEDRERTLNSNWSQTGTKWGESKVQNEFVPVEVTVYKFGNAQSKKTTTMRTSVAIGLKEAKSYIRYSTMSSLITPGLLETSLKNLQTECLDYKAEEHIDIVNQLKVQNKLIALLRQELEKKSDATTVAALSDAITKIASSDSLTTEIKWQTLPTKDVPAWAGKEHVFDFGKPVVEALAFVGSMDWRKRPGNVGDVHWSARVVRTDGTKVIVHTSNLFEGGGLESTNIHVIARVRK